MKRRALVSGATGQVGRAVTIALLESGRQVVDTTRDVATFPDLLRDMGAEPISFDREAKADIRFILGNGADAVIDTIAFKPAHG